MLALLQVSFGRYVGIWLFIWALALLILFLPGPFELLAHLERLGWLF
jgi:hypothetical protein